MPVYSSHLLRYEELRLGERVRQARQRSGLTLRQLAARLETSSARLSQIENERIRLDLQEVLQFADALAMPLDALIPPDVSLPYQNPVRRERIAARSSSTCSKASWS